MQNFLINYICSRKVNDSMESCTYDIDHNYTGGVNTAEASLSDHSYTVAAESPNAGVIPHDEEKSVLDNSEVF